MFRGSLETSDIDKVTQLMEVKRMPAEVVEKIEQRGEQRGMQQKAREAAHKMRKRGFSIADIADIADLSEKEIGEL
jgi:predicted transposase/invertase (TIGR01784 family)